MGKKPGETPKMNVTVVVASVIVILAGMMYAANFITQMLLAFFISIVLAYPILWLKSRKVPLGLAVAIVFIVILGISFGFGELIRSSLSSFSNDLPKYESNLREMSAGLLEFLSDQGIHVSKDSLSGMMDPTKVMNLTANFLGQLGSFMGNALTIIFLALFLLLELDSINLKTRAILKGSNETVENLNRISSSIRHYLSIKTITSLLTGVLIWLGLTILGVDYAIIWGLIAFLFNYIPNIGSIIAAIPVVLFALVQLGLTGIIWTTVIFVSVNMIIGNAVEPKMMGKGMGLSTFVVFLSLLFWGFILGVVGMFLSVPITMTIKIMLEKSPDTRWMAILLGTRKDAEVELEQD